MLELRYAEGCAWRGVYLYRGSKQICRATVDPYDGVKPTLCLAIGWRSVCIPLPRIRFRCNMGPVRLWFYRKFQAFWFRVDGRF